MTYLEEGFGTEVDDVPATEREYVRACACKCVACYECAGIRVYLRACACAHARVSASVCDCVSAMYVYVCVYACLWLVVRVRVDRYVYVRMCVYRCVYALACVRACRRMWTRCSVEVSVKHKVTTV